MNLTKPQPAQPIDRTQLLAQLGPEQRDWERRAMEAQAKAAQAYARLIDTAAKIDSGQSARVAQFIAATYNGHAYAFDLFDLRTLDVAISDDMLICMGALRWGKADLYTLVPDGDAKVKALLRNWSPKKIGSAT